MNRGATLSVFGAVTVMVILTMISPAVAADTLPLQLEVSSESGTKIEPDGGPIFYSAKQDEPARWRVSVGVARPPAEAGEPGTKPEKKVKRIVLQLSGPLARYAKIQGAGAGGGEGEFVVTGASAAQVVVEISAVTEEIAKAIDEAGGGIQLTGFAELETEDNDEDLDKLTAKAIEALQKAQTAVSAAEGSLAAKDILDPRLRDVAKSCAELDALERTINENVKKAKENATQSAQAFNVALGKAKACASREELGAATTAFNTAFGQARVASESYRAVEAGVSRFRSAVQGAAQAATIDPQGGGVAQSPEQRNAAFDKSIKDARESLQEASTLLDKIQRIAPPEGAEQITLGRKEIVETGKQIEDLVKKKGQSGASAGEPAVKQGAGDQNQPAPKQLCQDRKVPEDALNEAALAMQTLGLETITDVKAGAQFGDSFYAARTACETAIAAKEPKWFLVTHALEGKAHYENRHCAGKRYRVFLGREDAEFYKKGLEEENQRCKEKSCDLGGLYSRYWTPHSWTITIEGYVEKPEQPKDEWQCGEPGSGGG
jgi:hypothetical protein